MLFIIGYVFCMVFAWGIYTKTWVILPPTAPTNERDAQLFYFVVAGLIWPLVAFWNFVLVPIYNMGGYIGEKRLAAVKAKELHKTEQELLQKKILLELKAAEAELDNYTPAINK
jgi:hypothetical protein